MAEKYSRASVEPIQEIADCHNKKNKLADILQKADHTCPFPKGAHIQFYNMSEICRKRAGMSETLINHDTPLSWDEFTGKNNGSNHIRRELKQWANTIDLPEQIKPIKTQEAPKDITEIKKGLKEILASLWRRVVA